MDLILKSGAHGLPVQELQGLLSAAGFKVAVDGWFGDATAAAVMATQRQFGLVVDGVAGPKTMAALRGQDIRHCLSEADLQAAADKLEVPLASVKAVNAVESVGCGILPDGRPKILLERHVAYRLAKEAGRDADALAARFPAIINKARGGYAGGASEWVRFDSLRGITSHAVAVGACSWGLFQIMGYHWQALGYANEDDFKSAMMAGEGQQLDAFVRYMQNDPALLKAMRARKWADFARLYNGPAFAENSYDAKLAAAYARFASAEKAAA